MKLPVVKKTATGPAVDRRGRAAEARGRLSAAQDAARASRAVEAQVDLHRQAAADGERAHRAACTRPSRRPPRSPVGSRRPIPTCRTFPCAPPRAGASARRSSRRPGTCSSRPTTRRSSCASWRTCRRTRRCCSAFHEGHDIHRATAGEIFGVTPEDVTTDQRRYIKAINFGLIYGMSAFGLAQQLGIERGAAQQFIDKYFARYPGRGASTCSARARSRASRATSRRCSAAGCGCRTSRPAGGPRRAGAERAAINAPMQGTAADLIKLAMIAVQGWLDREQARDQAPAAGPRRAGARSARRRDSSA